MSITFSELKPTGMSFRDIESFAEQIAKQYDFQGPACSVTALAEKLGGKVVLSQDRTMQELMESGSLQVEGPGKFTIVLSPFTGELRNNFTVAHELGHYFLHSGYPDDIQAIHAPRYGTDRVEQEANRFAVGLLMPRDEFISMATQFDNNPIKLAGYFRVSPNAASVRLKSLGLVEDK